MASPGPRNLTPFMAAFRNLLIGRKYKNHARFEGYLATRTQEPPSLPPGVAHKLSMNSYKDRDGRRELAPPETVYSGSTKMLASGEEGQVPALKKPVTPGFGYNWETGKLDIN